jgi:hypothetical protein
MGLSWHWRMARPRAHSGSTAANSVSHAGAKNDTFCAPALCGRDPGEVWSFYIRLTEIGAAFKKLKGDLALRPIYHQLEHRMEAHIFVAFVAYCRHVTLGARLLPLAGGLTSPSAVLDKFAATQC